MRVGIAKITATYLFLLGVSAITFWATNSPASLWAIALVVSIGVLCFADSALTSRFSRLSFDLVRTHDEASPLEFVASLSTPWFVMPSRIEVDVVINNRLFGTEEKTTLVLRSAGRKPQTFTYVYPESACGKVDMRVERVLFFDVFGFTQVRRDIPFKASRLVYPTPVSMKVVFDRSPQSAYSGATFDLFKRGVDRSETLELRPYCDGDDPREVHWKLSAKLGEIFVREPSRPTDYNVVMLFGLGREYEIPVATDQATRETKDSAASAVGSGRGFVANAAGKVERRGGFPRIGKKKDAEEAAEQPSYPVEVRTLDSAISLFASLSDEMVSGGVGHAAALVDGDRLRLQTVDSRTGWGNMTDMMLSLPLSRFASNSIDLFAVDPNCAAFTKVVYVTTEINDEELQRLSDCCDVTVFLVGDVTLSQGESIANCDIVSVAPSQLEGRVEILSV